jgi:hypothetical protein
MTQYLAPGVYVEETSFRAPSIQGVGTSTAAFAGVTLTGPIDQTPELLTSFGDFQNIYGGYDNLSIVSGADPKNNNYLALSVKAFFDNGGSQLYVSRVFVPSGADHPGFATSGTPSDTGVVVTARFRGSPGADPTGRGVDRDAERRSDGGRYPHRGHTRADRDTSRFRGSGL